MRFLRILIFFLLILGCSSFPCRNYNCLDTQIRPCSDGSNFTNEWFSQRLDHFDPDNNVVWGQHYQTNRKFFKDTGEQRIFLTLGGEQDTSDWRMCHDNYTHMIIAQENNAMVVQLQHRFFGRNKGLRDTSVSMLQFLTVEQAIEDTVAFIQGFNELEGFTNPKWVLLGMSYSGTLAAYLRMTHPEFSQGAIASSAPMLPKVDFWEYDVAMTGVFNEHDPRCVQEIKRGFWDLEQKLHTPEGRAEVNKKFRLSPKLDIENPTEEDLVVVSTTFFYAFEQVVQRTYISSHADTRRGGYLTIENICNIMMNTSRTYPDRMYHVRWLAQHRRYPVLASYPRHVEYMSKTDINGSPTRGWTWMTCNQFGWFQHSSPRGPFLNSAPFGHSKRICRETFGPEFTEERIQQNVDRTLHVYGLPWNFNGTNTVMTHGSYDPWATLGSFVNSTERRIVSVMTKGSSHCADTFPYYSGEPAGLEHARQVMRREVAYYYSLPSTFKKKQEKVPLSSKRAIWRLG
ncbi:unnamed protein product [Bursaphelenchus xylophilus]|uniref:(pine wood nematode) hypothetical protein n=1 Tax=Bursaphelenchus xylophilus TaxID=6326 RepID=A0A1I7RK04_BURXY|nr:unnamed protein product [Bursaphelenchus xylophilus]CAG9131601.1 unnamed protein product [Bursaphelenchus xylophilus]